MFVLLKKACKLSCKKSCSTGTHTLYRSDINIQSKLTAHPNIVTLYGYAINETQDNIPKGILLINEWLPHGDLHNAIMKRGLKLTPEQIVRISIEICRGMMHLEEHSVVHNDLKVK